MPLSEAIQHRRTIYALNKNIPIDDKKIEEIVKHAVLHVPSSFNSQSARVVVLVKEEHDKFWDLTTEILKGIVPAEQWEHTGNRVAGFRAAYGTILFYEDPGPVKKLQETYKIYADKFPQWSEHTSAMHQYAIWTMLEAEGVGCNLQHYNPLPDQKAAATWNIPQDWSLKAQLVFGGIQDGAREKLPQKDQTPLNERLFMHGA
ncbi:hypothetical protein M433DRAFT_60199 [Acidomyces richmondensis BFW]|nr:MAG: hypothetical protein FE78DRAFT_135693 [Acidomyces sp. 'richmondensis']KYG48896.1 hypothetical protein M433DRAFT_60199 [Acidomyces richmondensis BFW]